VIALAPNFINLYGLVIATAPGFIGPKPHKFIWFGDCYGPNPDKIKKGLVRAMAPNQDCYQEKTEIGLPAGRRPAGGPMSVFSR
jgi:hypothetical protein